MKKTLSLALITGVSLTLIGLAGCTTSPATPTQPTATVNQTVNNEVVNLTANDNTNENAVEETEPNNINTNINPVEEDDIADTTDAVTPVVDEDVTWLATPEKLEDLHLLKFEDSTDYYKIADLSDGGELVYSIEQTLGYAVGRYRQDAAGQYYLLINHSDYAADTVAETFTDAVEVDETTTYTALDYPSELAVNGLALDQVWPPFTFNEFFAVSMYQDDDTYTSPAAGTTVESFGQADLGEVFTVTEQIETEEFNGTMQLKKYILKLADTSTVIYLTTKDFLADDGTVIGTFNEADADFADRSFFKGIVANGCGFPNNGDQIVADMTTDRLRAVGMTPSEETLYSVTSDTDPLLTLAYDTYKIGRDEDPTAVDFETFVASKPLLLWQDATGAFVVFMDQTYAPNVECGKPVIYLYPTEPTTVSVGVGADITVSEPNYGTSWTVTAQPNGQLMTADGTMYPNLFWEGKGHGAYPVIDRGRVVATNNIELELRHDLSALGLNDQETADFLEFWLPKMPTTNYVRLTWLGTREMDVLAPLNISPKPDTMIRVFLDFAGQNSATTNLKPQILTTLPRRGFTVVEWGGQLVGAHIQ